MPSEKAPTCYHARPKQIVQLARKAPAAKRGAFDYVLRAQNILAKRLFRSCGTMGQRCSLIGIDPQYLKIALKPDCSMWRQPSCNFEGAVKTVLSV